MGGIRAFGRGEGPRRGRGDAGTGFLASEFEDLGTAAGPVPGPPAATDAAKAHRRTGAVLRAPLDAVRAGARYMNAVLGGQDYPRYVEHLRRRHPDRPIPTESEYWRERHAAADRNPGTRCC
ncbi:YbdD/YjiX family protein [Nocardia elegans]|uniref:DUF466 domain-containing protein n=1 Tax=Nocardia nova TaxID=37330 RepID=A0A2T2Z420_9NOCA|nr:YbdD/YjiX family protein [Nocardia elegans]PSR62508.1 hypothetical protein C8259_16450 [Nocardia nova]